MEQQTVSIAKAGIICSLNARTSILASANPKESRYNPKLSVVQNIQLMPTLLSRFDLIYLILDQPNEHRDRQLARHLVSLYYSDADRNRENKREAKRAPLIPMEMLTAYISHVRKLVRPRLVPEAEDVLVEAYTQMRQVGYSASKKIVTATPRQLESLIRLSEALARMRMSPSVTVDDVKEAQRLMQAATLQTATDPNTGLIDMDSINTGVSSVARQRVTKLKESFAVLLDESKGKKVSLRHLVRMFNERQQDDEDHVSADEARRVLESIAEEFNFKVVKSTKKDDFVIQRL